jgi:ribosomal protein L19E
MTEGTIGAMIDVGMIVDVHALVTDETANPLPLEIPPRSRSQPPQSKMRSSRQRGQGSKPGKKRERRRKP